MQKFNPDSSIDRNLQVKFRDFCEDIASSLEKILFLKAPADAFRDFAKSAVHPFNIAVCGRMKTGKSTLVNALVGEKLAIIGTEETTATINVISHSVSPDQCKYFRVHWKDKPPESYPLENLQLHWSGATAEVCANVKKTSFIELYSSADFLKTCEITDTPGTDSSVAEHEKMTQNFLDATVKQGRRADAIIYMFSPAVRETDPKNLDTFRKNNCLPGSNPYNSIAVLHKWDQIFWENNGNRQEIKEKADRICSDMKSFVSAVIPVSAPLALAANASEKNFKTILSLCEKNSLDDIKNFLSREKKWVKDEERKEIMDAYELPWSTFQIMIREIAILYQKKHDISVCEIKEHLKNLSGITDLLECLNDKFIKHSELIRQKQKFVEIENIKRKVSLLIKQKLESLDEDLKFWDELYNMDLWKDSKKNRLVVWLSRKREKAKNEKVILRQAAEDVDRKFINDPISKLIKDMDALRYMKQPSKKLLSDSEISQINDLFDYFIGNKKITSNLCHEIYNNDSLLKKIASLCEYPEQDICEHASHIRERIEEFRTRVNDELHYRH